MKTLIFIVCMFLMGCSPLRNVQTNTQTDYSNSIIDIKNLIDSLGAAFNKQTEITANKLSNLKVENKTIYLSPPDSTGKQHTVKQTITHIHKEDKESVQQIQTLTLQLTQVKHQVDSLQNKINILQTHKESVKQLSWWQLHKCKVIVVICIIMMFFLIKRK